MASASKEKYGEKQKDQAAASKARYAGKDIPGTERKAQARHMPARFTEDRQSLTPALGKTF
ncbi:hypothetical protein [Pseudomonas sp. DC3000-4b1]|uniref:hypothetical protein n=1 Tax=unclassified Pseudomonas TaxID=196821 RepID=UPI003CF18B16